MERLRRARSCSRPCKTRVTELPVEVGLQVGPGVRRPQGTSDVRVVTVDLEADSVDLVAVGDEVAVDLPDGSTVTGSVSEIGTVAEASTDEFEPVRPDGGGDDLAGAARRRCERAGTGRGPHHAPEPRERARGAGQRARRAARGRLCGRTRRRRRHEHARRRRAGSSGGWVEVRTDGLDEATPWRCRRERGCRADRRRSGTPERRRSRPSAASTCASRKASWPRRRTVRLRQVDAAPPDRHARPRDRGTVRIAGQDLAGLSDRQLSGLRAWRIGFVFQQFFLMEGETALDNVADGLLYRGSRDGHGGPPRERRSNASGWDTG